MGGRLLGLAETVSGRLRPAASARLMAGGRLMAGVRLMAGGLGGAASVRRLVAGRLVGAVSGRLRLVAGGLVGTLSGPARLVAMGGRLVPEVWAGVLGVPPGPVVAVRAGRRFRGGLMRLVRTGSCGASPPSRSGALAPGARRWLGVVGGRRGSALMVSDGLRPAGGVGLVLVRLRWKWAVALSVL